MVREWLREKHLPSRGFRPHPERWQVSHLEQVLGRCAGEEGHLLFNGESVKVSKEEEITCSNLFKNGKHSKNGYRTRDYKDRLRRNVVVALLQILQPHRTTYITCWQVGFVEFALSGALIHWARIPWKATRQHAQEEKGGSINHLSPFLIIFYQLIGCLTATEQVQFPLLSRSNPGRYVREVEVDTDPDKALVSPPPARPRMEDEPWRERVPQKRKWDAEPEQSQREVPAAPGRSRATHEPSSRPKQKARKLVLPTSSAEIGRAAETRDFLSLQEDVVARVLGKSADFSAPKAQTPSEEARRPSGQRRQHAESDSMPNEEECLASEQVPLEDSPSAKTPSAKESCGMGSCRTDPAAHTTADRTPLAEDYAFGDTLSAEAPLATSPSARTELEETTENEGRKEKTRSGAAVAVEEASLPSSRESPRAFVATEILETEDESSSEGQEVESVQVMPIGVLCKQVVPLLRYLDRKAAKYADPRHRGSYVELVRNRTRTKVATNPFLFSLYTKYRELEMKNDVLHQHLKLSRKVHQALLQMRDDLATKAQQEFEKKRALLELDLQLERLQNSILAEELVRQTRALEKSEAVRKIDEELLR
ncbi:hypothetical protein AXG93_3459s1000 [Marchantia polymorpha subsp. ruderalis]|uniref:Uncharacterized protein n=1 Tax=Marchantia polymorpha subsp. ruderalis TaxID=1480154 RepID=A0A176W496_MARPO|nr:hypothetical protein AXG93_3459s1000 [Marchantia polymorpha subsp. ruderalis]